MQVIFISWEIYMLIVWWVCLFVVVVTYIVHILKWIPEEMYQTITRKRLIYGTLFVLLSLAAGDVVGVDGVAWVLRIAIVSRLIYGYEERRIAIISIEIMTLLIVCLACKRGELANALAVSLYYLLVAMAIGGVCPQRPRKREQKMITRATKYREYIIIVLSCLVVWVTFVIMQKYLSDHIPRKMSYRIRIGLSCMSVSRATIPALRKHID